MARNNGNGSRGGNRGGRGPNNNPEGRNQYSGIRGNPLAAAAAVGGAVAAGLFLWSRRDQIGEFATQFGSGREDFESDFDTAPEAGSTDTGRSQIEIAEEALTLKETGKVS